MTSDKSNPYIFECHNCGAEKSGSTSSATLAAAEFEFYGWLNEEQPEDESGKVEYRVTCPKCAEAQADYAEWAAMDDEQAEMGNGAWR